ncbi:MAG: hypothetical protein ACXV6K_01345 [Halobacteriota archaeon]
MIAARAAGVHFLVTRLFYTMSVLKYAFSKRRLTTHAAALLGDETMKKYLAVFLVVVMAVSVIGAAGVMTAQNASAARNDKPLAKPHVTTAPKNYEQLTSRCTFEWKPVTGAGGYYIEMKSSTDGVTWDDVSWHGTATSAQWMPREGQEGTTFMWRVKACVTDGADSPLDSAWTPWRTFTYVGSAPPPLSISVTTSDGSYSGVVASGTYFRVPYAPPSGTRVTFTFTATESGTWTLWDPSMNEPATSTGTSVTLQSLLMPISVSFYKQGSDPAATPDWTATVYGGA